MKNKNQIQMHSVMILFLMLFSVIIKGQDLAAYTNYLGHFCIFDRGKNYVVEDLPAQSFKIGGECVLYINSQGTLKMYQNGFANQLTNAGITKYFATNHLAAYVTSQKLIVVENGNSSMLSNYCTFCLVEDSMILFYDQTLASLLVYYNGEVKEIENGILGRPVDRISCSDNIVAYISSPANDFKVWYKGSVTKLISNIGLLSFKTGRDILAYVNRLDNTFHAFYKGNDYLLEDFIPKSYKMGYGFVVYVTNLGDFKIFYDGEISTILNYSPNFYSTTDNLILFEDEGYFKTFWKGQIYEIESYVPDSVKADFNSVVYLDNTKRMWFFSNGEKKYVLNDMVTSFENFRDLIMISAKVNRNIIYYKGKLYDGSLL